MSGVIIMKRSRLLVVGDIHGRDKALKEVLKLCKFDNEVDRLIIIGDIVDGGKETKKVVDILVDIPNKVFIIGNHDRWFIDFLDGHDPGYMWKSQGGIATLKSYGAKPDKDWMGISSGWKHEAPWYGARIPESHRKFFKSTVKYHVENDMLFVHGGYDWSKPIDQQTEQDLTWDRELFYEMQTRFIFTEPYKKVFIGHTAIEDKYPIIKDNIRAIDTGSGHKGRLTMMDTKTDEYWQSGITGPAL